MKIPWKETKWIVRNEAKSYNDGQSSRFMVLDPPHKLLQSRACRLRVPHELRGRPPAEMELLRRAYVQVMES
ncbi:hypothetical protein [Methylomicrobium lacus]|uniref:hypothetical protein n=1 Tax=Methylomicrobium lacus TaxID=136992 RepID=UPI0035A941BF